MLVTNSSKAINDCRMCPLSLYRTTKSTVYPIYMFYYLWASGPAHGMFVHMGKQQDTGEPAFPKKGLRFWPLSKFRAPGAHACLLKELTYMRLQQSHELALINNSMTLDPLHLHKPMVQSPLHSMHVERSGLTALPAKSDSNVTFCLQKYQELIIDRSLVY